MEDLIDRLERAEDGSRELSDEVLRALGGYEKEWDLTNTIEGIPAFEGEWWGRRPSPTESLDAALALVPEGWAFELTILHEPTARGRPSLAWWKRPSKSVVWPPHVSMPVSGAATPALALCIAILKAKA